MNIKTQNTIQSMYEMDLSVMALECLADQGGFDDQTQSLIKVLAKDLRSSFQDMSQKLIENLPKED